MEVKGKIVQVLEPQSGVSKSSGTPWATQGYVLETFDQYPRKVYFEVFGEERIKQNTCNVGDVVTVGFDIDSREFNARWYTTIRAWKISKGEEDATSEQQANAANVISPKAEEKKQEQNNIFDAPSNNEEGDLPF